MSQPTLRQYLLTRRAWLLIGVGFASGLPLLLVSGTLSIWMTNTGVDIKTIGLVGSVLSIYSFKFAWAPLLDRFALPFLGRRRGWMLVTQLGLVGAIAAMGTINPKESILTLALLALLVAFLSASQDVVADAWRTDLLTDEERDLGAGVFTTGYRLGIVAASPVALILSDHMAWRAIYWVMAGLMLLGVVATLLAPEPQNSRPPRTLITAVVNPFVDYFRRPGAVAVLFFLVLYKLGEAFAGPSVTGPFVSKLGFTNTEIGAINKLPSMAAATVGGLLGAAFMVRLGMRRSLYAFGVLQAVTNLTFLALALTGKNYALLVIAVIVDNLCGGMATTAAVAFMTSLCNRQFSATQYALLSALGTLGGRLLLPSWGFLVSWFGWPAYFVFTVVISAPALILLAFIRPDAATPTALPQPPQPSEPAPAATP